MVALSGKLPGLLAIRRAWSNNLPERPPDVFGRVGQLWIVNGPHGAKIVDLESKLFATLFVEARGINTRPTSPVFNKEGRS